MYEYTLSVINAAGEETELSRAFKRFVLTDVEGLGPPATDIAASSGAGDGSVFGAAHARERTIVLHLVMAGDVEENRLLLYRAFTPKKPVTLMFANRLRSVKTEGYVETHEPDIYAPAEKVDITLRCPSPWLESVTPEDFIPSYSVPLFSAPFSIEEGEPIPVSEVVDHPTSLIINSGDVECGFAAVVDFSGAVEGLRFANETAGTWFKLDYSFAAGDKLTLDTRSGRLAVTNLRNGSGVNMLRYMVSGSRWLKLAVGANRLGVTADSGIDNAAVTISVYKLFGGV